MLSKHSSFLDSPLTFNVFVRMYCVAIDIMTQVKCYRAILEVIQIFLPHQLPSDLLGILVAESWCLGASLQIGIPDDRRRDAAQVFSHLGGHGCAEDDYLGTLCRIPIMQNPRGSLSTFVGTFARNGRR